MLVKMKCPQCGAPMEIDDQQEQAFCSYCGTKVANLKEKVEITQNVNVSGTVRHVMDRSTEPNLYISYATAVPTVVMVVRIVDTGTKNTYLNGQTQSYHLTQGEHTIVLKIGKKNYNRTIVIPADNSPVRINAAYTGKRAEITIDQPPILVTDPASGQQVQKTIQSNNKHQSALAIISFILSFIPFLSFAALLLAILDLILRRKDKNHKHGLAIAALIIGTIMSFSVIMALVGANNVIDANSTVTDSMGAVYSAETTTEESATKQTTSITSNWEIDHYIDDFGDKTGSAYLRGTFQGKYSNALSSDQKLTVYFCYDDEQKAFIIRLLENNRNKASFSSLQDVILKVKLDDDKEYTIDLKVADSGNDLYFRNDVKGYKSIKDALSQGKEIKCVIKESLFSQTYNFTIDGVGFKEKLKEVEK